jgi:hypothetical protein
MRHDVSSPYTPVEHSSVTRGAHSRLAQRAARTAVALLVLCMGCGDGDDGDDGVSYETEIRPLLQARCVVCHDEQNALSLTDPFHPERGLFMVKNTWAEGHPVLEYNVVPFDPDASFLIQKISDEQLMPGACDPATSEELCPAEDAGLFMPPRPPPTTAEQDAIVRQWILEGAGDTPHFRERVVPFFGEWWNNSRSCSDGGYESFCVSCITCHYEDGPATPNLQVPNFEDRALSTEERDAQVAEWLRTVVGVKANFRSDLNLVEPGNPDASFLLMKIEAKLPTSAVGAPMPLGFEPLSDAQVETWRQWIREGARNN